MSHLGSIGAQTFDNRQPGTIGTQNFDTSQPGPVGTHNYEISQPEITYTSNTYENSQPDITYSTHTYEKGAEDIGKIMERYYWLTQWQKNLGLMMNDGSFASQSSEDAFGGQTGNRQENFGPTGYSHENPFTQVSNPDEDIDNSQPTEIISKSSANDDEDTEPPYPKDINDDEDSFPDESSGDEPPKDFNEPPILMDVTKNNDTKTVLTDENTREKSEKDITTEENISDDPPKINEGNDENNDTYDITTEENKNNDTKMVLTDENTREKSDKDITTEENISDDPPKIDEGNDKNNDTNDITTEENKNNDTKMVMTNENTREKSEKDITTEENLYADRAKIDEGNDENNDTNDTTTEQNKKMVMADGNSKEKNTTTPQPALTTVTTAEPCPCWTMSGTMSRPVPKLGLLFAPSLQWHVGIYSKTFTPYMQVCGGSLVKADVVLSAAHCFWNDDVGALRPGLFAVAAGKLLRPWENEGEIYTQHSDIRDIKIPPRFRGSKTSFQDDIAIVLLTRSLEYAPGVKPVCVSFDLELDQRHLTSGNRGKIAGWGLTEPNGPPSQRLNYLELPYVDIEECLRTAVDSFLKYITSDKICAGDQKTGRALCRGDSGGGLVFNTSTIPYLHGIASTAPRDNNKCNAYAVGSFTHVQAHRRFLVSHVPNIEEGCEELYVDKTAVQDVTIRPEDAFLTPNPSLAPEEDRISTNLGLESAVSNASEPQDLTIPNYNDYENDKNEAEDPISSTVPRKNDKNDEDKVADPISLTVPSKNDKNDEDKVADPLSLTVPSKNDKNDEDKVADPLSLTLGSQNNKNEEVDPVEPITLTENSENDKNDEVDSTEQMIVTSQNDKDGESNTEENITNPPTTQESQDDNNESITEDSEEPISRPIVNDKEVSNTEVGIADPPANVAKIPIWSMNESKEKEVMMNIEKGERGVARIAVDNTTSTFVCNCYCNK
ncbi:uncharacterized protein LOC125239976 [Leguminivora glycinivorella]|uniref:uncharacterized protein LOC125239976 n=1 Tax=Leguminivora glycinivorella TaxID=1035111 RepID=UPI00201021DF|nr:uncharacterized protein LOC125239976 [Leguminivora glycinivorella]